MAKAVLWLRSLSAESITPGVELWRTFLDQYFPPSIMLQLRDEIINFCQFSGEPFYEVWQRFNDKIMQYSNHEVPKNILLQIFYRALDQLNKSIVDNAFGGSLVKLSYGVASNLVNKVIKLSRGWHTRDVEVAMGLPPQLLWVKNKGEGIKREIEIQLNILTQHVMGTNLGAVNAIASKSTRVCEDEERKAEY